MLSLALIAVVVGGLANLLLGWFSFVTIIQLSDGSNSLAVSGGFSRGSLRFHATRRMYVYVLSAGLSFVFPQPLVTTGLGIGVSAGICGLLLIDTFIFIVSPDLQKARQGKWSKVASVAGIGAVCYAYSVYAGLNI